MSELVSRRHQSNLHDIAHCGNKYHIARDWQQSILGEPIGVDYTGYAFWRATETHLFCGVVSVSAVNLQMGKLLKYEWQRLAPTHQNCASRYRASLTLAGPVRRLLRSQRV